jgi:hypothetical protein
MVDIAEAFLNHCKEQNANPDTLLQFGKRALKPTKPRASEWQQPIGRVVGSDGRLDTKLEADTCDAASDTVHHVLGSRLFESCSPEHQEVIFGTGCFWGAEKGFWRLPGVISTCVGYAGGTTVEPTYDQVCAGMTGHTEVVRVRYDPHQIAFVDLLRWFWQCHDPTQVGEALPVAVD